MAYYNTCPHCGSNLDPGEPCDCEQIAEQKRQDLEKAIPTKVELETKQMVFDVGGAYEKAANY